MLEIELLGPPHITVAGEPLKTDRRKAIGLLCYLAAEPTQHSRFELSALLWPDYPQASAFAYLRRTLWELNQALGKGWVQSDREYAWLERQDGLELDVDEFHRLATPADSKIEALIEAAKLYRGEWMQGFTVADTAPFEQWQLAQVEHWHAEITGVLERLVILLEKNNDMEGALAQAQRWLDLDKLDEGAWRAVIRVQAGMGDRSGAIRTYQACARLLDDELGIVPQEETQLLYQGILTAAPQGMQEQKITFVAKASQSPINLPSPPTPFIGRREEIKQLDALVTNNDIRLITLLGVGGTGKTRLSIQSAAELNCCFDDGIWFVPLAAVQSLQGLVSTTARSLGFSFYQGEETPRQQLVDYLRHKQMLVILDNFEQLLSDGTELVREILETSPGVKLMVTSRERLNLQAEQIFPVGGLLIPHPQEAAGWKDPVGAAEEFSALRLFSERARRARPEFQLSSSTLPEVLHICRLVDGSPLGIELATAWLGVLPPGEIAREIEKSLDFLESTAADLPERQRSLRAVFEASWTLIDEKEQQAFRRLCVFRGSFSRLAAERVSGGSLRMLLSLVNKSWLIQLENGRFLLHEVLRQYGREKLQADSNEWEETKNQHADFFVNYVQQQGQALQTVNQVQALEALKVEMESNIPETWEWLVDQGRIDTIIDRMLLGIFHYWLISHGFQSIFPLLNHARQAVSHLKDHKGLLQGAILETVELIMLLSGIEFGSLPREQLKTLLDRVTEHKLEREMGLWYTVLVTTYGFNVNFEEGSMRTAGNIQYLDDVKNSWELGYGYLEASQFAGIENHEIRKKYLFKALEAFKKIGVRHEQGITLQLLGVQASAEMSYSMAIEYTRQALEFFEQVGDLWGVDQTWHSLAYFYIYSGQIPEAFHAFEVTRSFNEKSGNRAILSHDLSWESLSVSRYGKLEDAMVLRRRSLDLAIELDNLHEVAWHTWELGEIYRLMGDLEQAKFHYEAAHPQFVSQNDSLGKGFYHRGYGDIAMSEGKWAKARSEFELALVDHQGEQRQFRAWGLIYYHTRLAMALIKLGEMEDARQHIVDGVSLLTSWPYPDMKAFLLMGISSLLAASGRLAEAIEIAACVIQQPTTWNEVKRIVNQMLNEMRQNIPVEEALAAETRGKNMKLDELIQRFSNIQ